VWEGGWCRRGSGRGEGRRCGGGWCGKDGGGGREGVRELDTEVAVVAWRRF
jgi:hypothetical protein